MPMTVPISNLHEGDIISEPVINNFGQVLLGPGVKLNDKHIKLLKTWNIFSVRIKQDYRDAQKDSSDEIRELAIYKIKKRLLWNPRNNYEKDLINLGIKRIMNQIINTRTQIK